MNLQNVIWIVKNIFLIPREVTYGRACTITLSPEVGKHPAKTRHSKYHKECQFSDIEKIENIVHWNDEVIWSERHIYYIYAYVIYIYVLHWWRRTVRPHCISETSDESRLSPSQWLHPSRSGLGPQACAIRRSLGCSTYPRIGKFMNQ